MAFKKIILRPGINREATPLLNQGGYSYSQLCRFLQGFAQKMGGWQRMTSQLIIGTATGMHAWADLQGNAYLAIGTEQRLEVFTGGVIYDITPLRASVNIAVDFSTVISTPTVTVVDAAHGASVGDWIYIVTIVAVGGLLLSGYYQIVTTPTANSYTITAASNAASTVNNGGAVSLFTTTMGSASVQVTLAANGYTTGSVYTVGVSTAVGGVTLAGDYAPASIINVNNFTITASGLAGSSTSGSENGGNVRIQYLIPIGYSSATAVTGYGIGDYGAGDYGIASGSSAIVPLRQWFMDNWGQDLVANYTQGPIYTWTPPNVTTRATQLSGAPTINTSIFVMMPARILVATGTESGSVFDPNLIRWSDVDDDTNWIASSSNQAGSYRIPTGSRIVGSTLATQQGVVWTDIDMWSMTYQAPPFIFSFNKVGSNCGLIAGRAFAMIGTRLIWMSPDNFFAYDSNGVISLPCTVWDIIFQDLNTAQVDKIFGATNSLFNEVAFFFPSASGDGSVDSYVKLNISDGYWDYGTLPRTAWSEGGVFGNPIGADDNGLLQQHEVGNDADGTAMEWYIESGWFDIAEGQDFVFVDQLLTDFVKTTGAQVNVTLYSQDWPNSDNVITHGPYIIAPQQEFLSLRLRGRQAKIRIGSSDLGSFIRWGANTVRVAPAGRR